MTNRKVALVACTGMGKALGTVARQVAFRVADELRPNTSVLICLPSATAGVKGTKNFIKDYPIIALDGCAEMCASKITNKIGGKVTIKVFLPQLIAKYKLKPLSRTDIGEEGEKLVEKIAEDIAVLVDQLLK